MATLQAIVLNVSNASLLVCDLSSRQQVIVHTAQARCFCPGERICIRFNGVMTASIPPQISALCIDRLCPC